MQSLETLDLHNQTHNDIKPQNFLVKFKNGQNDLTRIEIVLTDFGMAGPDSQGGTPVFASPECFEKKEKKSDIFSFGRVILFLLLSKQQFLKWIFVPIQTLNVPTPTDMITLVTWMTSMTNRIDLKTSRIIFNELRSNSLVKPTQIIINSFDLVINLNLNDLGDYISELDDFRLIPSRIPFMLSKTFAEKNQFHVQPNDICLLISSNCNIKKSFPSNPKYIQPNSKYIYHRRNS